MMLKAVFIDFYGTVVYEDGEVIKQVEKEIFATGKAENTSEIGSYWWREFQTAFHNAYGDQFETQRKLEYDSLEKTIHHFDSTADAEALSNLMFAYWVKPPIFEESKQFFEICPVPVYVVSNIDRADVLQAIEYHGLKLAGVFTSEDAKSYKPRKELFEYALNCTGLSADEVVHIGDSLSSDISGAASVGINAIWVNRSHKEVLENVVAVNNLLEVFNTKYFKGTK
ncbi:MAG: HAD family hydrolase [Lachnospiraceae bacterium]|nr:HAD family hydrolase [Lachnospiraceae bacterium]